MGNDGYNTTPPGDAFGGCGGGGGGLGGFGPPTSQTQSHPPQHRVGHANSHEGSPLSRDEGNENSTQGGGTNTGGLAPINGVPPIATVRPQLTGQVSIGAVTLMSALMNTTQNTTQFPPMPVIQQGQQAGLPVIAPTARAPKGAVVRKLLDMSEARVKEELVGHSESKTKTETLRGAVLVCLEHVAMKIVNNQSVPFGVKVLRHKWRYGFSPKRDCMLRRPWRILYSHSTPVTQKLVQMENG